MPPTSVPIPIQLLKDSWRSEAKPLPQKKGPNKNIPQKYFHQNENRHQSQYHPRYPGRPVTQRIDPAYECIHFSISQSKNNERVRHIIAANPPIGVLSTTCSISEQNYDSNTRSHSISPRFNDRLSCCILSESSGRPFRLFWPIRLSVLFRRHPVVNGNHCLPDR